MRPRAQRSLRMRRGRVGPVQHAAMSDHCMADAGRRQGCAHDPALLRTVGHSRPAQAAPASAHRIRYERVALQFMGAREMRTFKNLCKGRGVVPAYSIAQT